MTPLPDAPAVEQLVGAAFELTGRMREYVERLAWLTADLDHDGLSRDVYKTTCDIEQIGARLVWMRHNQERPRDDGAALFVLGTDDVA